jgi:hypothetical protein
LILIVLLTVDALSTATGGPALPMGAPVLK